MKNVITLMDFVSTCTLGSLDFSLNRSAVLNIIGKPSYPYEPLTGKEIVNDAIWCFPWGFIGFENDTIHRFGVSFYDYIVRITPFYELVAYCPTNYSSVDEFINYIGDRISYKTRTTLVGVEIIFSSGVTAMAYNNVFDDEFDLDGASIRSKKFYMESMEIINPCMSRY